MVVGTTLYLECDADGDPLPTLSWKFNGKTITAEGAVVVTNRISLHNENTELEIENVTVADSGESFMPLCLLWDFSSLLRLLLALWGFLERFL